MLCSTNQCDGARRQECGKAELGDRSEAHDVPDHHPDRLWRCRVVGRQSQDDEARRAPANVAVVLEDFERLFASLVVPERTIEVEQGKAVEFSGANLVPAGSGGLDETPRSRIRMLNGRPRSRPMRTPQPLSRPPSKG